LPYLPHRLLAYQAPAVRANVSSSWEFKAAALSMAAAGRRVIILVGAVDPAN